MNISRARQSEIESYYFEVEYFSQNKCTISFVVSLKLFQVFEQTTVGFAPRDPAWFE